MSRPNDLDVVPTRVHVPEEALDDLRRRLRAARWPDVETVPGWGQGVPLAVLRRLCTRWSDGYDWRRTEDRLNAYDQFRTTIDGVDLHFLHVRSASPHARPLLVLHGWPGSVLEHLDALPLLSGDDREGGFHLVVPSLPGFGFSGHPTEPGWRVDRIAQAMAELMVRIGYAEYLVEGGDWGSVIATAMAADPGSGCRAVHVTTLTLQPPPHPTPTAQQEAAAIATRRAAREAFAYAQLQSTRPQTLAYGLADSPVGQAAWIYDKIVAWSDHRDDVREVVDDDRALDLISAHWLTNSAASSARLYAASLHEADNSRHVARPIGVSCFPADITGEPREYAAWWFSDLRYWGTPTRGGHFPALEQPAVFAEEVHRAFRDV